MAGAAHDRGHGPRRRSYFDTVSQIRMPRWSQGRVALAGDAAYAPSFLSGQGSSLALVGAYVLASELAALADPDEAFAAYERIARPFIEANQALAVTQEGSFFLPRTQAQLDRRNQILASLARGGATDTLRDNARAGHRALILPEYRHLERSRPR